jgi:hypothetical protein
MATYEIIRIKDTNSNSIFNMIKTFNDRILSEAKQSGYSLYGFFLGLLGLSSNELYLAVVREDDKTFSNGTTPLSGLIGSHHFSLQEHYQLSPTVRPTEHTMRTREGIYVFRWFDVRNRDVDEIVKLSDEAWTPFEEGFDSEIQGLFAESDRSQEQGKMLLLTWYRDFSVWEASRRPSKEAKERFLRRHDLTIETVAIATRLFFPHRLNLPAK